MGVIIILEEGLTVGMQLVREETRLYDVVRRPQYQTDKLQMTMWAWGDCSVVKKKQ